MATYRIDGKSVSKPWHIVLTHYRRVGGSFRVNSGRRTMAEQWRLYRAYKRGTGNLAAYPHPGAPHINYGRANHAIDVDNLNRGADRMVAWLAKEGIRVSRPVRGEPWHIVVDRDDLLRRAREIEASRRRNRR